MARDLNRFIPFPSFPLFLGTVSPAFNASAGAAFPHEVVMIQACDEQAAKADALRDFDASLQRLLGSKV